MEKTDFTNVKVGDKIVYRTGGWYGRDVLAVVAKVTPKQFEDKGQIKFRKEDGKMIGESYRYARYATEEDIRHFKELDRRGYLMTHISNVTHMSSRMDNFSTEDLEAVYNIIKKYEK